MKKENRTQKQHYQIPDCMSLELVVENAILELSGTGQNTVKDDEYDAW